MILKTCIMTNSTCYKETTQDAKTGIIIHSTGCNNAYIKRYVQPTEGSVGYSDVIADIGKNYNRNDWNHKDVKKGVHAFIGKNSKGVVEVYQVLPYELNAWGVAAGVNGSVNYGENARIQFEVCEDGLKNKAYFNSCIEASAEYCAYLCKQYGWDESKIWSHKEAIKNGYGSGSRVDIDYWMGKFGYSMDKFRSRVKEILADDPITVGSRMMLKDGATVWNKKTKFSSWVYKSVLWVTRIKGDRVWFSIYPTGATTGTTDIDNCIKLK